MPLIQWDGSLGIRISTGDTPWSMWISGRFSISLVFRYRFGVEGADSAAAVPVGAPLSNRIAPGMLTMLITRELMDDMLVLTGRREQRKRLPPARVVVYFTLAMALLRRFL
jgi:hypothetical protein